MATFLSVVVHRGTKFDMPDPAAPEELPSLADTAARYTCTA